jgi:hypothetical protein
MSNNPRAHFSQVGAVAVPAGAGGGVFSIYVREFLMFASRANVDTGQAGAS